MQRFLTAAAVVASVALATTSLATAQTSTSPRSTMPSTSSPSSTSPGVTSPSTGAATIHSSAANTDASMDAQSPETIKQAQQQLKSQGLYNGAIDGQMGPETASALSKFQQKNGLPANSELDQQTMAKLMGNGSTSPNAGSGSEHAARIDEPEHDPVDGQLFLDQSGRRRRHPQ